MDRTDEDRAEQRRRDAVLICVAAVCIGIGAGPFLRLMGVEPFASVVIGSIITVFVLLVGLRLLGKRS